MNLPRPSKVITVMAGFGLGSATFLARSEQWLLSLMTAAAVALALFVSSKMEDQGQ